MADPSVAEAFARLVDLMARLRAPGGCPWDREQTPASLRPYLLEEVYEVLEAIDAGDAAHLRDELGDLLLQIVFQSQLAAEAGRFTVADVAHAIADKLVRRHPHVFGDVEVRDAGEVVRNWRRIKAEERRTAISSWACRRRRRRWCAPSSWARRRATSASTGPTRTACSRSCARKPRSSRPRSPPATAPRASASWATSCLRPRASAGTSRCRPRWRSAPPTTASWRGFAASR